MPVVLRQVSIPPAIRPEGNGSARLAEEDIELMDEGISSGVHAFVKGIIKLAKDEDDRKLADGKSQQGTGLVLWIDIKTILDDLVRRGQV